MDMTGSQRIEASRETVWAALNDAEVLKQCIPGCESVEKLSDTELKAKVTLRDRLTIRMEAALSGEPTDDRRKAMPIPGGIGEPFDASGGVRRSTRRAAPLFAARFVADLGRTPWYGLRSASAGSAKIGCSAAPSELSNGLLRSDR